MQLVGIREATKQLWDYPTVRAFEPTQLDNQSYLEAVVLSGPNLSRGHLLTDTGAAFSILTERVEENHGLKMKPLKDQFRSANSKALLGEIIGTLDVELQVYPNLVPQLKNMKVYP